MTVSTCNADDCRCLSSRLTESVVDNSGLLHSGKSVDLWCHPIATTAVWRLCVTKIFESMRSLSHLREWCLIILPFQQYVLLACGIVWAKAQRRMQQQSGTASHEPFPDE
jgi:hypothetical protein